MSHYIIFQLEIICKITKQLLAKVSVAAAVARAYSKSHSTRGRHNKHLTPTEHGQSKVLNYNSTLRYTMLAICMYT